MIKILTKRYNVAFLLNLLKNRPALLMYILASKLGINTLKFKDVRLRDRKKLLGLDPDTINAGGLAQILSLCKTSSIERYTQTIEQFLMSSEVKEFVSQNRAKNLASLFNHYGSDKATTHDYYRIYQPILDLLLEKGPVRLAEIGIGTNNIDTLSNMGVLGNPGASLRAFRDYNESIMVSGGDIDRRIFFTENRISTSYVDQLKTESVKEFIITADPTILIDDGLHALRPNINVMVEFLKWARTTQQNFKERWLIIEDIDATLDMERTWRLLMSKTLTENPAWLLETKKSLVLVVNLKAPDSS